MQVSLAEGLTRIAAEANTADVMVRQRDFAGAKECVRLIMGHASKLYGRLSFLDEMERDAKFVAEVDRAVTRAEKKGPLPIPGDRPLPLAPGPGKGGEAPPARRPRKGKG